MYCSDLLPSSSSDDETKIPNDVYFGGPEGGAGTPGAPPSEPNVTPVAPVTPRTPAMPEGKKRGRPKGSTNKPKPPELQGVGATPPGAVKGQVGRPRGGGHSGSYMRPFKRDFSGIRFRRSVWNLFIAILTSPPLGYRIYPQIKLQLYSHPNICNQINVSQEME